MIAITLRRLVLLMAVTRERVTAPDIADALNVTARLVAKNLHSLAVDSLVAVAGWRMPTDRDPGAREFAATEKGRLNLRIPLDTPLVWPQPKQPARATVAAPAAKASPKPDGTSRARPVPQPQRAGGPPDQHDVDDDAAPLLRAPRQRTNSGSGVIAGWITIGRGYKWGSH